MSTLKKTLVKKGQILQSKGDLNSKVYIVESGLLRSYTIDKKGKEHIFLFAPEDWLMADGIPSSEPCDLFIDALEDSTVNIREKDFNIEHDISKLAKRLSVLQRRIIMLMSSTAIERYEHFVETYPQLIQRVPQRMIASYLGITPEALASLHLRFFH